MVIDSSGVRIPKTHLVDRAIGALDPSTGETTSRTLGDYAALLTGYMDPKGRLLVQNCWMKRKPPSVWIKEIFELHKEFEYSKFGVETNLYRNLLMPNILEERKRQEKSSGKIIRIPFYDIENTENKEKRIEMIEPKVSHGYILFNKSLGHEFFRQLEEFPRSDHDDGPDALEMLWRLGNNAFRASPLSINAIGLR